MVCTALYPLLAIANFVGLLSKSQIIICREVGILVSELRGLEENRLRAVFEKLEISMISS